MRPCCRGLPAVGCDAINLLNFQSSVGQQTQHRFKLEIENCACNLGGPLGREDAHYINL